MTVTTYIDFHLVRQFSSRVLPLLSEVLILVLNVLLVPIDSPVEVGHHSTIHVPRFGDLPLMALQCLLPSGVFGWIIVLDHPMIPLRHCIAAIVQWLDLAGHGWHVSCQSVLAQVNVALQLGVEQGAVGRHAPAALETATRSLIETALSVVVGTTVNALTFSDEVVLEVGTHLTSQTLSMLVKHLTTDKGKVI